MDRCKVCASENRGIENRQWMTNNLQKGSVLKRKTAVIDCPDQIAKTQCLDLLEMYMHRKRPCIRRIRR